MSSAPRCIFSASFVLLLTLLAMPSWAELVEIRVPSEQRSEEAEASAVTTAFKEAVNLLSGDESTSENEELMTRLGEPHLYLNSYYDEVAEDGTDGWVYVVGFEKALLEAQLKIDESPEDSSMDAEILQASTNDRLIWMVVEQQMGDVFLLTRDTHSSFASDLRAWLSNSEQPWVMPPESALGAAGLSISSILNKDTRSMLRVSESLGFDSSMAVVLTELGPSSWFARVSHVGSDRADDLGDASSYAEALSVALGEANDGYKIVEPVAQVEVEVVDTGPTFHIAVANIMGYGDFSRVTNYLSGLASVDSWSPRGSAGGVARFEVTINVGRDVFLADMTETEASIFKMDLAADKRSEAAQYRFEFK